MMFGTFENTGAVAIIWISYSNSSRDLLSHCSFFPGTGRNRRFPLGAYVASRRAGSKP